jgi:hypothetical protein
MSEANLPNAGGDVLEDEEANE